VQDIGQGSAEEIFVEIVDQVGLDKTLQAEHDNFLPTVYTTHAGRKIGYRLCDTMRQHFGMNGFIKVTQKHGVCHIWNTSIFS
jgi:hypothetical protein